MIADPSLTAEEILERVQAWCVQTRTAYGPAREVRPVTGKVKGKNVEARMLKTMADNHESHGWTANQWAVHLDCSAGTVKETVTWKVRLKEYKAALAANGASRMDRSRTHPSGRRGRKPT